MAEGFPSRFFAASQKSEFDVRFWAKADATIARSGNCSNADLKPVGRGQWAGALSGFSFGTLTG
jgi:Tfp pilus assembly protein PilV